MLQQEQEQFPPQLPPMNNLPQWSRVNTLDRARYPKPFLKDRLQPLPSTMDPSVADSMVHGNADMDDQTISMSSADSGVDQSQRLQHLERNLRFLQQEHKTVLQSLHGEIDVLKRQNQDLQFRVIMVQRGTPGPPNTTPPEKVRSAEKSRSGKGSRSLALADTSKPTDSHQTYKEEKLDEVKLILLQKEIEEFKKILQEEKNKNEYLTQLIEQAQTRFIDQGVKEDNLSEAMSAPPHLQKSMLRHSDEPVKPVRETLPYNPRFDPLTVLDVSGGQRAPTVDECEIIIKHLLKLNDKQTHELSGLKSDLRDVLYSHKWSPDAYLLAKAYVVDDDAKEAAVRDRLPKLALRQQSRKLPEVAYIQHDQVTLPALKQTMGNKAIERRKRTQMLQKSRQRREVLH